MITVIDYEAGNGPSVVSALGHLGFECRLASSRDKLLDASHIILPGVGAASATLASLEALGLVSTLQARVKAGVPFLGICVGFQVLFDYSEEGDVPCLGWFRGRVRRYNGRAAEGQSLRVPQIGWNEVTHVKEHPVLKGVPRVGHYYFVNSYYVAPEDPALVLGEAHYGVRFAASIAQDNVVATLFHVEKSGPLGLKILANFAAGVLNV
jgi:imidazole glycerol-phosphate synthase subunit HisH